MQGQCVCSMLHRARVVSCLQAPRKQRALSVQVYDRVTPKTEKVLRATRAATHNVTVSEDPVMKCALCWAHSALSCVTCCVRQTWAVWGCSPCGALPRYCPDKPV